MEIGQFIEYRGYVGSIEYNIKDKLHYGKLLNIKDLVNYHADDIVELQKHYHEAVDDYIELENSMRTIGVVVLRNEVTELTVDGQSINLIGIDDPTFTYTNQK